MTAQEKPLPEQTFIEYYEANGAIFAATIIGHYCNQYGEDVYILQHTTTNGNLETLIEKKIKYINTHLTIIEGFFIKRRISCEVSSL